MKTVTGTVRTGDAINLKVPIEARGFLGARTKVTVELKVRFINIEGGLADVAIDLPEEDDPLWQE